MCDERAKTRCVHCELVQWADHANCRRCCHALSAPIVNIVERVVEKVVIRQDSQCVENLLEASKLISATASKLQESLVAPELPIRWGPISGVEPFPTLDAMERAMIVAAYRKTNRKPIEAARLLGIGKTTFYRKLREIRQVAA
jgi:transcriptional regulator of acetoin/glycerol metabolism